MYNLYLSQGHTQRGEGCRAGELPPNPQNQNVQKKIF